MPSLMINVATLPELMLTENRTEENKIKMKKSLKEDEIKFTSH